MPTAALLTSLSSYLADTRRLLRDGTPILYSDDDLKAYINRAIRQRDLDLGKNRVRMTFTLTAGVFDYPFATIASGGVVVDGNTNAILQDIFSIIVMPIGGAASSTRVPLGRWPYTKLAPLLSTNIPTYPVRYAIYGPSTVMIGPPPAFNYPAEFDFIAYSPDLVNLTDTDIMPYPWTDPVPFMAASIAKVGAQRFDEAKEFGALYADRMNRARPGSRIVISNPWSDLPRG